MSSKLRWLGAAVLLGGLALPPAAGPAAVLSPSARAYYQAGLAETAAGRFATLPLSPIISPATDPLMDAVVQWDRLRRDNAPASFAEIVAFIRRHPGWPAEMTLRRRAEKLIDDSVPFTARIDYFRDYPPVSAYAKFRLAEALLVAHRFTEANAAARDAWDSAGLDPVSEIQLQQLFTGAVTPADTLSRLDRLLWTGQSSAAQRLLPLVQPDRRAWAAARIALRSGTPAAAGLLAAVPAGLQREPGLLLDRVLWLKRSGDLPGARTAMADYDGPPGLILDPEQWLKLRLELARGATRDGQDELAYRLAAGHAAFPLGRPLNERTLGERQGLIDNEWLAGWIALRKLGRPTVALTHFQRVRDAALTPVSQARGDYWSGRAAEAAAMPEARIYYAAAATHADYYYGQLAAERLGPTLTLPAAAPVTVTPAERAQFEGDELVRVTEALGEMGDRARQTLFMRALVERADTPEQQRLLADLGKSIDRPDLGVLTGKAARLDNELTLLDVAYPRLELPSALAPTWTMVHAIARQETQFDRAAVSSANARGLMQLLPATAAETASKLGLPYQLSRLTDDPVYNVTLGSAYFSRIRDNLGGSLVLAVAAYNAGPGNVRRFIALNGDPRIPGTDVVDWVEAIPFSETRDYVQRVLANAVVYDLLHPATTVMPTNNRLSAYLGKKVPG
ncbi:MAG: lytic transglycosylase domain-containing protein [Janthinobacterium lividum]